MIRAKGLTKFYGEHRAIEDINFEVESGEIVGILGLNGAGKTTTLRILSCLLLPTSGSVELQGVDILENPHAVRSLVGFLPETPPLYPEMTVEAFLSFAGQLRGLSGQSVNDRLERVLELTDTKAVRHQVIDTLSHGYRQRVGIAQAIIHDPPVLILDEPISGLDPKQIVEVRQMLCSLRGEHTILISSHNLPEISQTCDRLLIIDKGALVASCTEEELTARQSGGHRLLVGVHGDLEKSTSTIKALENVSDCVVVEAPTLSARPMEETHYLQVDSVDDVRETIAKDLVNAGIGLVHLAPAELESMVLQLLGGEDEPAASPRKEVA
jgi:ABC-2 type transport system ATP-binding protein